MAMSVSMETASLTIENAFSTPNFTVKSDTVNQHE